MRLPVSEKPVNPDAHAESSPVRPLAMDADRQAGSWCLGLLGGFLALILLSSLWLRFTGVMVSGEELTYDRALFLSVSTATLTGFQQSIGFNDFNPESVQGPMIMLVLTLTGSLFAMIVGGLASVRILRFPYRDLDVVTAAMTVELLAVLAGTAALLGSDTPLADAVHRSACAFGNSGAVIVSRGHTFPTPASWEAQGVLLPLAVLGGLGLPVLMDLYFRAIRQTRRLSFHTRTALKLTAGVYLTATALLFIALLLRSDAGPKPSNIADMPTTVNLAPQPPQGVRGAFVIASTTAINARTAGLPFELLNQFPKPAHWIIVLLMVVGASSAGTGGGIKITTFWQLFIGLWDVLQGRHVSRALGIAGAWVGGYLFIGGMGFFFLSISEPQMPAERLCFLTISALSNVGLSHDPVNIVGPGLFLLDLIMLLGRLAPLGVLWWMARTECDADVLVG